MKTNFDHFIESLTNSFNVPEPIINNVLANIFSMRIIGNKTHGDLAEIALTEYINIFVDGYSAKHTGKDKFRAKSNEEDISVIKESTGETILISVKTYGYGPLQLSTNKDSSMFNFLSETVAKGSITDQRKIHEIIESISFSNFNKLNVIPLIYNEKEKTYKIIIFDVNKAYSSVQKIKFFPPRKFGGTKETHPIYKFLGQNEQYIFEVRYGDTKANALQRGMWTHTEHAGPFFRKLLEGTYEINEPLVKLMSKILVSKKEVHQKILELFFPNRKPSNA